ncbi:MAG: hypothetical protein O7D33_06165 [Chloroflexi bacterium]|nr:hypothetical protein [Chloroflexota bacterium]
MYAYIRRTVRVGGTTRTEYLMYLGATDDPRYPKKLAAAKRRFPDLRTRRRRRRRKEV